MTAVTRSDSNTTESRWSEETSFKVANGSAIWNLIEPNSFSGASAKYTKVARTPIKSDRQRDKGVLTDLDATFGFQTDLTQYNSQDLMQGLIRAALRKKTNFGGAGQLVSVNGTAQFTAASGLGVFAVGALVVLRNGTKAAGNSNKVFRVTVSTATALTVTPTPNAETLPANATLTQVGVQTAAGDVDVDASGALPKLTSTVLDFTTLGLVIGQSMWIGGDGALEKFAVNAVNNCLVRIRAITATALTIDKASKGPMITESQAAQTIQLYFGDAVLKNELGSLIIRKSYQLERSLNFPDDALPAQIQSEYYTGAVFSKSTLTFNQAEKIVLENSFLAADQEVRTGATGLKAGTRPAIETADAQNTTSDLKRVRLAKVIPGNVAPTPLVTFIKSAQINIDNNDQPLKALTVLGAFEMSQGDFAVSGSMDCYFADIALITSVRNNDDCTLDIMEFRNNQGWTLDLPLITLDDASVTVAKDQPIMVPLNFNAASGEAVDTSLDYTACFTFFSGLPALASSPNI